jgi:hypothetical protein
VNYNETSLQLSAGSILTNTAGCASHALQISLDDNVNLPAYTGGDYPSTTTGIHVVQAGTAGNVQDCSALPAFAYCSTTCDESLVWTVYDNSGGFSGGTDAQTYSVIQQSDIDTAANSLKASTTQSANADINSHLHSNEHLVGTSQCTYKVSSDHAAGDKANTVRVTVQTICTATAST